MIFMYPDGLAMCKAGLSEYQSITVLKSPEVGRAVKYVRSEVKITESSNNWNVRYYDMVTFDKRLK
ncbi:hypothetical protein CJG84_23690 [Salmonella enterica]|nr:hypothetical protein [Salmonella enterica subsp. enterica serovar Berlin]ECT9551382.1 hypothetical protein [Salmonella enterica]ECU8314494.1 hypothetical protein [Salmonella enterica subsp. enterica serovar Oslo]